MEDAELSLRSETLVALQEFLSEQRKQQEKENQNPSSLSISDFQENWQISQFWYTDETAEYLGRMALGMGNKVALLCCPSVMIQMLKVMPEESKEKLFLFEYDTRFRKLAPENFYFYDYNQPTGFKSKDLQNHFDAFLIDPPFLSEECFEKVQQTVQYLAKGNPKIMISTGMKMFEFINKQFGVQSTNFKPQHQKERLQNPFGLFTNFSDSTKI